MPQLIDLKIISLLLFFVTLTNLGYGQKEGIKTTTPHYSLFAITNQNTFKGDLLFLNTNSIAIKTVDNQRLELDILDIQQLKFRRKGSVGKGIFIGAISGMGVGAIIGYLSGDDPAGTWIRFTAGDKALALGGFLTIPGMIAGGIIGSKCIKIPIENKQSIYNKHKPYLKRFER